MKFSSILVVVFLQNSVHAAAHENQDIKERRHSRLDKKRNHQRNSQTVRHFTVGAKSNLQYARKHQHKRKYNTKIVGGDESDPDEFPYYVDMGGCGGSLIAPDVVLSAAHCGDYTGDSVVVGAVRPGQTSFGAVRVQVAKQVMHPAYDNVTEENDVMVLKLAFPVTRSTSVELVLNDEYSIPANGNDLTVLGLGDLVEDGPAPTTLMDVVVQAIDTDQCNSRDSYDGDVVDEVMLCAGVQGGGKDSCHGDSGGPIVKRIGNKHLQVGIVSWGIGCAEADYAGVYTRVSGVYDWITSVVCDEWQADGALCGNGGGGNDNDDNTGGGGGDDGCRDTELDFDFTIRTDDYGNETSWEVTDSKDSVVLSGEDYGDNRAYETKKCIPQDCYSLTIFDSYGDGLSEGGSNPGYLLQIDGRTIDEAGGEDFGDSTTIDFGECGGGGGGDAAADDDVDDDDVDDDDVDDDDVNDDDVDDDDGGNNSCISVNLEVRTDDYGDETEFFMLTDQGELIWDEWGLDDNEAYQFSTCLSSNVCATLDIFDWYGDGIESPGNIKLTVDGQIKYNSGNFDEGLVFRIGGGC